MRRFATLGVLAALALMVQPAWANSLVANGSFEIGVPTGDFVTVQGGDTTSIQGWEVTGASVDYIGTYWTSADGVRSLDLDGTPGAGGVKQDIATVPGQTYTLSFALAGNPTITGDNRDLPYPVKTIGVNVGVDGMSQSFTFDFSVAGKDASHMGWVTETLSFTATSETTTLSFRSMDDPATGYCGPALDNVVVVPAFGQDPVVPEPVTLLSAFSAISGLGLYIRKRTRVEVVG
jgi:choice-of-anchor C domain-containing protein